MRPHVAALGTVALFAIGCTKTGGSLIENIVRRPPTCADAIRVYASPARVGTKYQEVALLSPPGNTAATNQAAMRKKAADMGANGIIIGNIDEPAPSTKLATAILGASTERKGKSVAIFVASDTARVRTACAAVRR